MEYGIPNTGPSVELHTHPAGTGREVLIRDTSTPQAGRYTYKSKELTAERKRDVK